MQLDLSDLRSVRAFVKSFTESHKRLDILVNNAGMSSMQEPGSSNIPKRTPQGIEIVFGTNFVGPFALTLLLLDLLKAAPTGRIVNLSSVTHRFASRDVTLAASGAVESKGYENSKLAMAMFTRELRRRLAGSRVLATAANPGFVASDIWRALHAVPVIGSVWQRLCGAFALTTAQGAAVSVAAATAPPPASEDDALYLQPYWLPLGIALPFEMIGPFAGARPARSALPADEPAQSRELWRLCEGLAARE
jgi:NAD(P)-dependent dehydrogenase (short-subunit alcohol dehydrogenase family)